MANKADIKASLESDDISGLNKAVKNARGRALTAGRKVLVSFMKGEAPIGLREFGEHPKFGKLRESIGEVGRSTDTVEVGSDSILALWTEFGTQKHRIAPKYKKAISYPEADHPSAHVMVSATENPWMRRATAMAQDAVAAAVETVFKAAIDGEVAADDAASDAEAPSYDFGEDL